MFEFGVGWGGGECLISMGTLGMVRGVFDQGENCDHKDEFGVGWGGGECLISVRTRDHKECIFISQVQ